MSSEVLCRSRQLSRLISVKFGKQFMLICCSGAYFRAPRSIAAESLANDPMEVCKMACALGSAATDLKYFLMENFILSVCDFAEFPSFRC